MGRRISWQTLLYAHKTCSVCTMNHAHTVLLYTVYTKGGQEGGGWRVNENKFSVTVTRWPKILQHNSQVAKKAPEH